MAVEVVAESPLAKALQEVIGPKLVELGWSTGMQDETLSEYIILMLANGKSQEQIASELSNDLLDLGPEDQGAIDFTRWLFEQIESVNAKINGTSTSNGSIPATASPEEMHTDAQPASGNDAEMGDASTTGSANIPTGPKAMRNGSLKTGRGGRLLGQINKTLNQPQDVLHRVRAGTGSGRINSHASRDPPKGPRAQQIQRGLAMTHQRPSMGPMHMPGMPMGPQIPQQGMMMTPQDQMQFMATLAETAQQMAYQMQQMGQQLNLPPQNNTGGAFGSPRAARGGSHFQGRAQHDGNRMQSIASQDTAMSEAGHPSGQQKDTAMGGQEPRDLSKVACRFDLTCTKADCPYAHHSPEARPGIPLPEIDMENECSFGVRCSNKNCNGRHPSRAKRAVFQAEQDCLYGPWCHNLNCPFKHPEKGTKECRNGGDCTVEGCTFWHNKVECKHNPCKNVLCKYKHKEGQKLGSFGDHIWRANGEKPHISERKFVDENAGPEEYVGPSVDPDKMMGEAAAEGFHGEARDLQ